MSQPRTPHNWLLVVLLLAATRAPGADPALLGQDMGIEAPRHFIEDWVVAPIPISNPTIGTGLAVVAWEAAPPAVALFIWLYVFCVFIAVEAVELARLLARVRAYGWSRGIFSYRVSQWSRNFTFGMFYAFTLALSQQRQGLADPLWLEAIWAWILAYGPYLVLALLLGEVALYLSDRLDCAALASIFGARGEGRLD